MGVQLIFNTRVSSHCHVSWNSATKKIPFAVFFFTVCIASEQCDVINVK